MMEIKLTKDNFKETVMEADQPVLIDFWATWCGPCKMIAPIIAEIAEERNDIVVCKVNVDEEEELSAQFGISSIPTLVVIKNGKVTAKSVGYRPKAEILNLLEMG
ncbi:MAG: thioredoxin [Clostridiales bacterium]|nr:thioredoxin [Clostridiales bacterium]